MKTFFINGACGGVGQATVKAFHEAGYQIWASDVNQAALAALSQAGYQIWASDVNQAALAALSQQYPNIKTSCIDVNDKQQLKTLCDGIAASPQLDVAHVNAGVVRPSQVTDSTAQDIDLQLDINLRSTLHINRALAIKMKAQKSGHIVNTVSMGALISLPGSAVYCATKAALRSFLTAMQAELKPFGVSVSGIYPSGIHTPMLEYEALNQGSPLNFLNMPVSAEKVASTVLKSAGKGWGGKQLEYYLPYSDSISSRIVNAFPWLLQKLYPLFRYLGEKGRAKYIRKFNVTATR